MTDKNCKTITKRIGSTIFKVTVYFSDTESETMEDKILRIVRNDILEKSASCGNMEVSQMSRSA